MRRKTPTDYHVLAEERGFHWLGPEVPNVGTKTNWQCERGHRWAAPYNAIQQGRGCPFCAGRARKTPADYHTLAVERGFRWLGPEVPNTAAKTNWQCGKGHQWEAPYNSIRSGRGCPFCAGRAPKTPADYRALAEERGFRWVGHEVSNIHINTGWVCEQDHYWQAPYSTIQQGHDCPVCAGTAPKTPADYLALARERHFRWLGPVVPTTGVKTGWECEEGHQWEATYNSIQQGNGCPVCAGTLPKTAADYHTLAEERGFRWLGPEVPNIRTKTGWECEEGHHWEAPYGNVQQGSGCPFCAGKAPKTPADYQTLAEERRFRWLGPEALNVFDKTSWECGEGHQWEACYNDIRSGRGCPICVDMVHGARVSRVQRDLCELLGGELNCPCGPYRIDVALNIDGVKIAVEYDSWFWHGHELNFDRQRDEELIAEGWRVLHVKSNQLLPSQEQLDGAVARLLAGEELSEIVLDDWGEGDTRFEADCPGHPSENASRVS